jgi:hypothetical protein
MKRIFLELFKISLTVVLLILSSVGFSQKTDKQVIADSSFGWMKVYHFKGVKEPRKLDDRTFSIHQLSICDSFANWIQASYIPKGTIGDVKKVIMPQIGLYNKHQVFSPQGFGATSYTWSLEMKNGKAEIIRETEIPWGITANEVPGRTLENLCTNGDYYFFMEETDPFENGVPKEIIDQYNIKTLSQFKNFHTTHSTASRYDRNANYVEAVLLCKNNQLPFLKVSIEDLLSKAEKLILTDHENKLKDIREKNKDNQKSIDYFSQYENDNFQKALVTLAKHKEKYKNKMNERAFLPAVFYYIDFVNGQDIFTRYKINEGTANLKTFPVYKFAAGIVEQSKQDKPLWIRVTWSWSLPDERTKHMHESIINNFNFQYLYDFFFDREKVKNSLYKPLIDPSIKAVAKVTEKSTAAKKAATDKSIHFFDDFSSTAINEKPIGWFSEGNSVGSHAFVTSVKGEEGKWMVTRGNTLTPTTLARPLPLNFSLSFDVAVPRGFTWGAKSLEWVISTEKKESDGGEYISFKMRPGFDGRAGSSDITTHLKGTSRDSYKYGEAPGFSNNKDFNRVTVMIRKKDSDLLVFFDGQPVKELSLQVPPSLSFNTVYVKHSRSDAPAEMYYISNIKITKE